MDHYVRDELQGKVKLVRNQRREGLIRGRMIGASHATGTSYIFVPSLLVLYILVFYLFPLSLIPNLCILIPYTQDIHPYSLHA